MIIHKTNLEGLLVVEPKVYEDDRGFFLETFNLERYQEMLNMNFNFVQDNHSKSSKNVLRGLHFQINKPQGKLVRVVAGTVLDVAIDIRKGSSSFGEFFSIELSDSNKKQLWIPPGFAHGFLTLSKFADLEYKCTEYYDSSDEGCIIWNDPSININWPIEDPLISDKDELGINLGDLY